MKYFSTILLPSFLGTKKTPPQKWNVEALRLPRPPKKKPDESQHAADHSSYSLHTGYTSLQHGQSLPANPDSLIAPFPQQFPQSTPTHLGLRKITTTMGPTDEKTKQQCGDLCSRELKSLTYENENTSQAPKLWGYYLGSQHLHKVHPDTEHMLHPSTVHLRHTHILPAEGPPEQPRCAGSSWSVLTDEPLEGPNVESSDI